MTNLNQKRLQQAGIQSLGDLKRSGSITEKLNPELLVYGPKEFDCLINGWQRQEGFGVIGDSSVGKSEVVLNMALDLLRNNPESVFIYVSLEMTDQKLGERIYKMAKETPELADRFFIISRYNSQGKSRDISMRWIKSELLRYREQLGDVVAFAIDHLHVMGENDPSTLNSTMATFKEMCVEMNSFGIMMAQVNKSSGQKGEVPLDSDSVLGCSQFKYICSDIIQIHRPILRLEEEAGISVLGWGYTKIREQDKNDPVKRGQNKLLIYDYDIRGLRKLSTAEFSTFKLYYNELLEMKSAEERHKAFTYDLQKEIVTKDGKKITIKEKFSGDSVDQEDF